MKLSFACLFFLLATALASNIQQIRRQLQVGSNQLLGSDSGSGISDPLVIALIVLVSFNVFIFITIYVCSPKLPYQVNIQQPRFTQGQRYPRMKFETNSHCLIEQQQFQGKDCYQSYEIINSLPALIYGRQFDAEVNNIGFLRIDQCRKCRGLTRTIQIFKYGKLRQCWQTLFMLLISPCFLAFTIRRITSNTIIWMKFFCTECGSEKYVQK